MQSSVRGRVRLGATALGLAGLLFALFPLIRPFGDDPSGGSQAVATAMASDAWVVSHLLAALGFLLLVFGVLAIHSYLSGTDVERLAFAATIVTLVGAILLFAIGGIEGVALNALGRLHLAGTADVLEGVTAVRMGPGVVLFVGGLLAFALGGVLLAVAIWRSGLLPPGAEWPSRWAWSCSSRSCRDRFGSPTGSSSASARSDSPWRMWAGRSAT